MSLAYTFQKFQSCACPVFTGLLCIGDTYRTVTHFMLTLYVITHVKGEEWGWCLRWGSARGNELVSADVPAGHRQPLLCEGPFKSISVWPVIGGEKARTGY